MIDPVPSFSSTPLGAIILGAAGSIVATVVVVVIGWCRERRRTDRWVGKWQKFIPAGSRLEQCGEDKATGTGTWIFRRGHWFSNRLWIVSKHGLYSNSIRRWHGEIRLHPPSYTTGAVTFQYDDKPGDTSTLLFTFFEDSGHIVSDGRQNNGGFLVQVFKNREPLPSDFRMPSESGE